MKKLVFMLSVAAVILATPSILAKGSALDNGFSLHLSFGFEGDNYGQAESSEPLESDYKFGSIYGIELGNRWYIMPQDKYGFGIMVNWIDFAVGYKKLEFLGVDLGRLALDLTFLEFGPIGTFAITNDIALDGYYNLRPTWFSHGIVADGADPEGFSGVGITHSLGFNFRYRILSVGIESVFGTVEGVDLSDDNIKEDVTTNNFRLKLGIKL